MDWWVRLGAARRGLANTQTKNWERHATDAEGYIWQQGAAWRPNVGHRKGMLVTPDKRCTCWKL